MNPTAALLAASLAVGVVAAPTALAAPKKKPVVVQYTATAGTPDPTNGVSSDYSVCAQTVPGSFDSRPFKVPAAGRLKIELTGYQVDWDLLLMDAEKSEIAGSGSGGYMGGLESVEVKMKKAQTVHVVACNWAGGPTGNVKITFTYA